MAAYAALVSLMQTINDLQRHPRPPITLHKQQLHLLTSKLTFLQRFLEGYNPHLSYSSTGADPLEIRIADAAHAAEDAIESHIVDRITNGVGEENSSNSMYEALEEVVEAMASIEKESSLEINWDSALRSSPSTSTEQQWRRSTGTGTAMVGAEGVLLEMKDKLISHRLNRLRIVPIVGMGGTGKTTLALNIYHDGLIKEHFDICAWATISQEYSTREIFVQILAQLNQVLVVGQGLSEDELGEKLYKHLYGRRYLNVMDDMWSIDAWDSVMNFFPNNDNGSRIVVTTRLSNLASTLSCSDDKLKMELLDEVQSWELLSKTVFGGKDCPLELEEIGRGIGKSCQGLPLSIVVVGGLLAKSEQTVEFWRYVKENLSEIVNSRDDERCLKILYMSYKQLPVYLKPCFLYMGVFPEDKAICNSCLVRLWVAEGFLKPMAGRSLEEVAAVYLNDLIDRNLVLVNKIGISGEMKQSKMHDLLRDLCLREAEKENFYTTTSRRGLVNAAQRQCQRQRQRQRPHCYFIGGGYCSTNLDCLEEVSYLGCLDRLESLSCGFSGEAMKPNRLTNYPHSLKKLSLEIDRARCWEEMVDKIGELPLLQKLKLKGGTFQGGRWETGEGQFRSLKFLSIRECFGLKVWIAESSHFPCLEHLVLNGVDKLEEIPFDFAEILTLRVINMKFCSTSALESALRILEEQEGIYGEPDIRVQVFSLKTNKAAVPESLSRYFRYTN